jgi:5'-methylthioadenosine phosphorylase
MKKTRKTSPVKIAIIGGSGLYEIEGIKKIDEIKIKTPWGFPSDSIIIGDLAGVRCAFLPRHGRGHRILPGEINSRANIYALKALGVEQIVSISACGSLREEIKPRDYCIPDQIFDRTKDRAFTFFGSGIVAHVGMAEPYCNSMRAVLSDTAAQMGVTCHNSGTYVCIEGPQFSTKAESNVNRKDGFSIVGMTAIPEAKLAREAEICYSTVAIITDYDVWKEGEEVSLDEVMGNLSANVASSKAFVKKLIPRLAARPRTCACGSALKYAVVTKIDGKNRNTYNKLKLLLGKYHK